MARIVRLDELAKDHNPTHFYTVVTCRTEFIPLPGFRMAQSDGIHSVTWI